MISLFDIYHLLMVVGFLTAVVFGCWLAYEGIKTLRIFQDILADVKNTSRDLVAVKDGIKGAVMLANNVLTKWQRGGGVSGRGKK
jgi:hypothetical protein